MGPWHRGAVCVDPGGGTENAGAHLLSRSAHRVYLHVCTMLATASHTPPKLGPFTEVGCALQDRHPTKMPGRERGDTARQELTDTQKAPVVGRDAALGVVPVAAQQAAQAKDGGFADLVALLLVPLLSAVPQHVWAKAGAQDPLLLTRPKKALAVGRGAALKMVTAQGHGGGHAQVP